MGRQANTNVHADAGTEFWSTPPSSYGNPCLLVALQAPAHSIPARTYVLSLSLLSAAAHSGRALPCWCGACLSRCGKEIEIEKEKEKEKEKRGERERQAGNKWQFRCAQADGGVAGPLCRLTVLTPAARRHHKPHRSAASTQVLIRRRARGMSTPPRAQTTSSRL